MIVSSRALSRSPFGATVNVPSEFASTSTVSRVISKLAAPVRTPKMFRPVSSPPIFSSSPLSVTPGTPVAAKVASFALRSIDVAQVRALASIVVPPLMRWPEAVLIKRLTVTVASMPGTSRLAVRFVAWTAASSGCRSRRPAPAA